MNAKERVRAALEGRPVDRAPVATVYTHLYDQDHFSELAGLPAWRRAEWEAMPPGRHAEIYAGMRERTPFDILQPLCDAPPRDWRERQVFWEDGDGFWRRDSATGERFRLGNPAPGQHAADYTANHETRVRSAAEIGTALPVVPAKSRLAEGANDYLDAVVRRLGRDGYVVSGGVIGTLYSCHWQVGLENLYVLLHDDPALIEAMSERVLAQNIETIRRLAAAGGDGIYIDDATATADVISPAMYRRFALPYTKAMVDEIHRLGHQATVVYFGSVMDRLEDIASTGADGFAYEASMKGYVNDTAEIARRVGDRLTLFTNIDPVSVLQDAPDGALDAEIGRQLEAARPARGVVLCTGSPITPRTPLARVRRYIESGRRQGAGWVSDRRNAVSA